ncbi:MAG: hypothetical protein GXZ15_04385 [Campylobacter sp.]|nr:hypothetical protein [Campylobacter sp.]
MSEAKDKYDIYLDDMIVKLKECQQNYKFNSCLECEKLLDCQLRDEYVKASYESMSKGQDGGFEF